LVEISHADPTTVNDQMMKALGRSSTSGGKPPSQPRDYELARHIQPWKSFNQEAEFNLNKLGVGKAGLPPLYSVYNISQNYD